MWVLSVVLSTDTVTVILFLVVGDTRVGWHSHNPSPATPELALALVHSNMSSICSFNL